MPKTPEPSKNEGMKLIEIPNSKVEVIQENNEDLKLMQIHNSKKLDIIRSEQREGLIRIKMDTHQLIRENESLKKQVDTLVEELKATKQKELEQKLRKERRKKRRRLPKRDPMTLEIYNELMKQEEGPTYLKARLRLAICILFITGIRLNELLPLKVYQLETLFKEGWIAIDRSKRGPSNHKAFLTTQGKKILKERAEDYEYLCFVKESEDFIFTSEANPGVKLCRETLTRAINKAMRKVSKKLMGGPNITSHSFRIGYITKLWRDTKDLEFVRQSIGHRGIQTTSSYVTQMSDIERQERINKINN